MPAKKGNQTARRSPDGASIKKVMIYLTPRERLAWQALADTLQLKVTEMVRNAVEDYRLRAIGAGLKLKK
jgi:hypothetical protein